MKKILLILILGMFLISFASAISISDATSYWTFNETSGTTAYDGKYLNNGTNYGASVNQIINGNKFYYFVTDDAVNMSDSATLEFANNFSLCARIFMNGTTGVIMEKGANSTSYPTYGLVMSSGKVQFYSGVGLATLMETDDALLTGQEYFICGVHEGTGSNLNKIYINGALNKTGTLGNSGASSTSLGIGKWRSHDSAGVTAFNGYMRDVSIWDSAINSNNVRELYGNLCYYEYGGVNTSINCNGNITLTYPIGNMNYARIGETMNLFYNDTIQNFSTTFTLTSQSNLTLYFVNATDLVVNATLFDWDYKVFENSRTANESSYETDYESFSINVTTNSSLTNVYLNYSGTFYGMTNGGSGIWSKSINIHSSKIGNNSINYLFTYLNSNLSSDYFTYQNVQSIYFTLCNATYTTSYLNISFIDEADDSSINATIPTSTFTYYLGTGIENKTYTFVNSTEAYYQNFCFSASNNTLYVLPYIQYKQGTDYPQRIWQPSVQTYTNSSTNKSLYLLNSLDGIPVTFLLVNIADQTLSGVQVIALREINGEDVNLTNGLTGDDGSVTFWLNPDFIHTFTFIKSGFDTKVTSFIPTQTGYTITLTGGVTYESSYMRGIKYSILPLNTSLVNDTVYTFGFNLTSSYYDLQEYGFSLRLSNGTIISGGSSSTSGSQLTLDYNTTNLSRIYMDYYWKINDTYSNGTTSWKIYNTDNTQWSIKTFFQDFNSVMDSGVFGIDKFGRYLITFLILFLSVGIIGYKYGINNSLFISGLIFFIVLFLDVALGIIPTITLLNGKEIPYILTFLAGLIFVISILNEVKR